MPYRGGFPVMMCNWFPGVALRHFVEGAVTATRCGALRLSDSSPRFMPRWVRVDALMAIPVNVAETTEASLDMTAEVVEAAPIECRAEQVPRPAARR